MKAFLAWLVLVVVWLAWIIAAARRNGRAFIVLGVLYGVAAAVMLASCARPPAQLVTVSPPIPWDTSKICPAGYRFLYVDRRIVGRFDERFGIDERHVQARAVCERVP